MFCYTVLLMFFSSRVYSTSPVLKIILLPPKIQAPVNLFELHGPHPQLLEQNLCGWTDPR